MARDADLFGIKTEDAFNMIFGPRQQTYAGSCIVTSLDAAFAQIGAYIPEYVAGRASYRDVFDKKNIHVTEFCFLFTDMTIEGAKDSPTATALIARCPTHNCAD